MSDERYPGLRYTTCVAGKFGRLNVSNVGDPSCTRLAFSVAQAGLAVSGRSCASRSLRGHFESHYERASLRSRMMLEAA